MKKQINKPPKIAKWLLRIVVNKNNHSAIIGDLEEEYRQHIKDRGFGFAWFRYWCVILFSLPSFFTETFFWSGTMFRNYIKIAIRNMRKDKRHTFINITGLSLGMAIFILISMYTRHEISYDKFHKNHKEIYQIQIGDDFATLAPLASQIDKTVPDVESIVRFDYGYGGGKSPLFIINEESSKKVKFSKVLFADQTIFEMFSFQIIHGDSRTALKEPYSLVLTRSASQNLFDTENSIGKTIHYIGDRRNGPEMDMTVTAIVEDPPTNSTIQFNALSSFSTLYAVKPTGANIDEDWRNWGYTTYVLLKDQQKATFQQKLNQLWLEREKALWPENKPSNIGIVPLADTPFHNNNKHQLLFLIQLVGIFILAMAMINFVNLTIAKSSSRAKEIGIRKIVGSVRFELIKQFLVESMFISIIIAPIAILIIEFSKVPFYNMINKHIPLDIIHQPMLIFFLVSSVFAIGIIAGIYPALFLSSFKPSAIIKGEMTKGKRRKTLRFGLFVFQFVISASLIICTILISRQLDYLRTKSLGFNHENIIHFKQNQQIGQKYDVFKQKLLQNPNITSVARSNHELGRDLNIRTSHELNGVEKRYRATTVDPDFISTMGIEITEGRTFSWEIKSDQYTAIIVNETFVKEFELEPALGAQIKFLDWKASVIGVMKDFHYSSFHQKLKPSALLYANWNSRINIKLGKQNISQTIKYINETWNELSPQVPFEYEFLDETYGQLYKAEEEFKQIISTFSMIAIIIACFGLFGLISYSVEQRTKEIGVHKVLGASVVRVIGLLSKEYVKWVIIANLIAWPIAWYAMNNWLQNFAYRIHVSWWMFVIAVVVALFFALLTVSWQAIKAARTNPATSLKYE